jgi:hypothetical protein
MNGEWADARVLPGPALLDPFEIGEAEKFDKPEKLQHVAPCGRLADFSVACLKMPR